MNIRNKFQLVVMIIPVLLISSIAGYCYLVLIPEYSAVEVSRVEDRMDHVRAIYDHMIESLDRLNWDWASWDDMYEYVESPQQDFIESNYVHGTFIDNKINIMLILDMDGNLVFSRYIDFVSGEESAIPGDLLDHARDGCLYNSSGTLVLDDFMAIYSSRPILTSTDEGTPRGSHIMLRIIDSSFTEEISFLSQQNLRFERVETPLNWDVVINAENDDLMKASSLVADNHGLNTVQISLLYERSLFQKEIQNMFSLLVYLVFFAILFIGVSHYLAEVLVLKRLTVLTRELDSLSGKADPSLRLTDAGDDEIGK